MPCAWLGGEPGVAQHLAAHVVDDAGFLMAARMAATVRAASIERVDALDVLNGARPVSVTPETGSS
jgi:hypothetical protein